MIVKLHYIPPLSQSLWWRDICPSPRTSHDSPGRYSRCRLLLGLSLSFWCGVWLRFRHYNNLTSVSIEFSGLSFQNLRSRALISSYNSAKNRLSFWSYPHFWVIRNFREFFSPWRLSNCSICFFLNSAFFTLNSHVRPLRNQHRICGTAVQILPIHSSVATQRMWGHTVTPNGQVWILRLLERCCDSLDCPLC